MFLSFPELSLSIHNSLAGTHLTRKSFFPVYCVLHEFADSLAFHFSFSKLGSSPSTLAQQSTENNEPHGSYECTDVLTATPLLRCDGVSFA